jgi:hypothetical protein
MNLELRIFCETGRDEYTIDLCKLLDVCYLLHLPLFKLRSSNCLTHDLTGVFQEASIVGASTMLEPKLCSSLIFSGSNVANWDLRSLLYFYSNGKNNLMFLFYFKWALCLLFKLYVVL